MQRRPSRVLSLPPEPDPEPDPENEPEPEPGNEPGNEPKVWPFLGAILSGGQSLRMGEPKEGARLPDGRAMIEPVLDALRAVCRGVVVVGACRGFRERLPEDVLLVEDELAAQGPLGGLDALLRSGLSEAYLVVACDQPLLTPALLRHLTRGNMGEASFFRDDRGEEHAPFPGVFPSAWAPAVREAVLGGRRGVRSFLRERQSAWVQLPSKLVPSLASINDRDALARLF